MANPTISVNLVVLNGGKYIRRCLESVLVQIYPSESIEINVLDNGSTDDTKNIINDFKSKISSLKFVESKINHGMWGGQEELLKQSGGKYIVVLSADVILEKDFILNAARTLEANPKLGAVQGKIYQYRHSDSFTGEPARKTIDTCGFKVFRSRRIVNIGHGETDKGQFDKPADIFGVEGAVPVLRAEALQSTRVLGEIADHDLFWYAEDLDVAWRLRMTGWEQRYEPSVVAWHDRQTTKSIGYGGLLNYIRRAHIRGQIPLRKRKLEWRNIRWTIIKNDYIINILKDLPFIVVREVAVLGYMVLFEPRVFAEVPRFIRGIPRMLRKRKEIMEQAKASPSEIHAYFS